MEARSRCWIHEDCLADLELSMACGPNPPDMPALSDQWDVHAGFGDGDGDGGGWGDGDGDGDGYKSVSWADGGVEPSRSGYGQDVNGAQHYPAVSKLEALNAVRMLELARACGAVLIVNGDGVVKAVFSGRGGRGDGRDG